MSLPAPVHRLLRLMRVMALTPGERRYLRKIRKSGLFDRTYYRGAYPGLNPLYLRFPENHYIAYGEGLGYRPNPDFSPEAYLRYHPDVAAAKVRPFLHYVQAGRFEQRIAKELPEVVVVPKGMPRIRFDHGREVAPYAVVVHIYYPDLWPEFAERLRGLSLPFDLYVTLSYRGEETEELAERIRAEFPRAFVTPMPNRGRDILPFVTLLNSGALDGYRAVCKFHTKKSPHRKDGDAWRKTLIDGILPETGLEEKLEAFVADPSASFWVADEQHFIGTRWWGSNIDTTRRLLQRIEIPMDREALSFPAGSIYWVKPLVLGLLRSLDIRFEDFEAEEAQVDGTTAHAIERVLGFLSASAGQKIVQTSGIRPAAPAARPARPAFVSAFYLPQFHPVPENDAWWGKGFTEWRSVVKASPMFDGHLQPMLPADLGFYDLRATEVMGEQASLARGAGIDAFCVYHYWFDGRRILEAPIDRLMERPEIDFPFYLCWANESWRRNWDGLSGTVLLEQTYAEGFEAKLAADTAPYLRDPRYARPDGLRPRFVIYRPEDMPDPEASVARLREAWLREGIGEVELGAVRFHVEGAHPVPDGLFDFWVEMPPHGLVKGPDYLFGGPDGNRMAAGVDPAFSGLIYDYAAVARRAVSETYLRTLPKNTIAGIMPSWDNTARRGAAAHVAYGANPGTFNAWLEAALARRVPASYRRELFVNAWNEWAEKAILEPSLTFGDLNLQVMRQHLGAAEPAARSAEPPAQGMRSH